MSNRSRGKRQRAEREVSERRERDYETSHLKMSALRAAVLAPKKSEEEL